jgi:ubiquinone/menaquinone biosynthesis C-methylase UbiE
MSDQLNIVTHQYQNANNLNARIALHQQFSTNPRPLYEWVLEFYDFPPQATLLELGCGSAMFWKTLFDKIPTGWDITLTDFSEGMLQDAQTNLGAYSARFHFQQMNAQDIQFPDHHFDAVAAHHMLYHVPDRPKAFAEINRVLKPNGLFLAATNGENHLAGMEQLLVEAFPQYQDLLERYFMLRELKFTLENGEAQLRPFFNQVTLYHFGDSFHVTEAEPLVAYILSSAYLARPSAQEIDHLRQFIQAKIDSEGAVNIQKSAGLFVCR